MKDIVINKIDAFLENSDPKTDILRRRLYENIKNDCRVPDRKASTELIRVFDRLTESDQLYVLAALPHMLQLEKTVFNKALRESERGSRYHESLVEYAKICLQEPATKKRLLERFESLHENVFKDVGGMIKSGAKQVGSNIANTVGKAVNTGLAKTAGAVGNEALADKYQNKANTNQAKLDNNATQINKAEEKQQEVQAQQSNTNVNQNACAAQGRQQQKQQKKADKQQAKATKKNLKDLPKTQALIKQIEQLKTFQESTVEEFIRLREQDGTQAVDWSAVESWAKNPTDPDLFEAAKQQVTENKAKAPKNAKKIANFEKQLKDVEAELGFAEDTQQQTNTQGNNEQNNNSGNTGANSNGSSDSSSGDNSSASNKSSNSGQPVDAAKFAKVFGLPDNVAGIIMNKITQHGGKLDKLSAIKESANKVVLRCWRY